jgi:hypothetical protein
VDVEIKKLQAQLAIEYVQAPKCKILGRSQKAG